MFFRTKVLALGIFSLLLTLPGWSGTLIVGWSEVLPEETAYKPILRMALLDALLGEAFDRGLIAVDTPLPPLAGGEAALKALLPEGKKNGASRGVSFLVEWTLGSEGALVLQRVTWVSLSVTDGRVLGEGTLKLPEFSLPSDLELTFVDEARGVLLAEIRKFL